MRSLTCARLKVTFSQTFHFSLHVPPWTNEFAEPRPGFAGLVKRTHITRTVTSAGSNWRESPHFRTNESIASEAISAAKRSPRRRPRPRRDQNSPRHLAYVTPRRHGHAPAEPPERCSLANIRAPPLVPTPHGRNEPRPDMHGDASRFPRVPESSDAP
jgi:hypothetical protein